jgi:hypothetical protein
MSEPTDWIRKINAMARHEKYIFLGVIASAFAYADGEPMDWHYRCAPPLYFVADFVPVTIDAYIPKLDELDEDSLLELCETLVIQLRQTREAA